MLSLAEYVAARAQLQRLAKEYEEKVEEALLDNMTRQQKISVAQQLYDEYWEEFCRVLGTSMSETAVNAKEHYANLTGLEVDRSVVDKVIDAQFEDKYYGATLAQRLDYNKTLLKRRTVQSAGIDQLSTVLTGPLFGSQSATDQRLLLGTVAKIEQDMAKEYAGVTEHKLMRWTLSHRHSKADACDDLASNVDRGVVAYLRQNDLNLSPKGLYFAENIPHPPHPNCQCEYGLVLGTEVKHSLLHRTTDEMKKILRKLWGK